MEKTITIMNNKNVNQSKSKVLFILLIVLFAPLMLLSQNESDNQDFDGHDYINRHKSQIDFLPIDSILEKTWQVDVKNDVCVPLVVNNLIFPSVLERVVINSENGLKYDFGSQEAIRLFDKEKFDSIICFPANECISLINIYTNQVIFSFKRYLRPNREGPFFPENNILYYGYNNLLIAYNFRERRNLWQTEIDNYSKNFHLNYKKYIIINDMSNLLLIEKNTGKIEKKYKTRNSYSKILKDKELFYVGSNEIVKINLETLKHTI